MKRPFGAGRRVPAMGANWAPARLSVSWKLPSSVISVRFDGRQLIEGANSAVSSWM